MRLIQRLRGTTQRPAALTPPIELQSETAPVSVRQEVYSEPFRPEIFRKVGDMPVRLNCKICEVAWSGPKNSACWVCDAPGIAINSLVNRPHQPSRIDTDFESQLF